MTLVALLGRTWLAAVLSTAFIACASEPEVQPLEAEIGVFYGGQIQRLKRVEVSRVTPPKLGFRLLLPQSFEHEKEREFAFEVVAVGPAGRRVTRHGSLVVPLGERSVDQVIDIPDSARLGVWNVRVTHKDTIVADRAIFLVPKSD